MSDREFWRDLQGQFRDLRAQFRLYCAPYVSVRATLNAGRWEVGLTGDEVPEGRYEWMARRFRIFAERAGMATGVQRDQALQRWMNLLRERIPENFLLPSDCLGRNKSQREVEGIFSDPCQASIDLCMELETAAALAPTIGTERDEAALPVTPGAAPTEPALPPLARNIQRLRKECGWTYALLAEKVDLDDHQVRNHAHGVAIPRPSNIRIYADVFGKRLGRDVTVAELESLDEPPLNTRKSTA